MKIVQTPLSGVLVIEPELFKDDRGYFFESYHQKKYADAGIPPTFVQDNQSRSVRGILRGLHAQLKRPQGKLVRVLSGEIFDVILDIRRESPTYKKWFGVTLSGDNFRQCWIPPGFAHGFCVTSDSAEMAYKVTDFYDPTSELHLLWNDSDLKIDWPIKNPILSAKDRAGVRLKDIENQLPVFSKISDVNRFEKSS
jgi:dTDP-4-dehydrorhamnose 3,5-epimerase